MYMGELVRLVVEKLTKEGLLLGGKGSDLLFSRGRFYTKYVSEIESDPPGTYTNCKEILEELGNTMNKFYHKNLANVCYFLKDLNTLPNRIT